MTTPPAIGPRKPRRWGPPDLTQPPERRGGSGSHKPSGLGFVAAIVSLVFFPVAVDWGALAGLLIALGVVTLIGGIVLAAHVRAAARFWSTSDAQVDVSFSLDWQQLPSPLREEASGALMKSARGQAYVPTLLTIDSTRLVIEKRCNILYGRKPFRFEAAVADIAGAWAGPDANFLNGTVLRIVVSPNRSFVGNVALPFEKADVLAARIRTWADAARQDSSA